jgi:tRNA 5-methylaminomethyl-2-thiouridine biosynthesis bifunctional protein
MWSEDVMRRVAALSAPGTTFATFTVAAPVRQALCAAGFEFRRESGYGRKREMLCGVLAAPAGTNAPACRETPWHLGAHAWHGERKALVVGAGIAGCTAALALARRGWQVEVLEALPEPASAASGNPQAVLFTQLALADSPHADFTLHSYLHALRFYRELFGHDSAHFAQTGALQLLDADSPELRQRYRNWPGLARFVDAAEASRIAGVQLRHAAIHLPASGWMDPRRACALCLEHPRIATRFGTQVSALQHHGNGWTLASDGAEFSAPVVVIANGVAAADLLGGAQLPLAPLRGQITVLPEDALQPAPLCVICAEGYITPAHRGLLCCGASFIRGGGDGTPSIAEQRENLLRLQGMVPAFDPDTFDPAILGARVGYRCATPDRLPAAGAVADPEAFACDYAGLGRNAKRHIDQPGRYQPGLFLSTGHGSRGMTSAPLCAELIAASASDEPLPVSRPMLRALSPARFQIRSIIKGKPACTR